MNSTKPQTPAPKYLKDYKAPDHLIPKVDLHFNLDDTQTLVRARLQIERANPAADRLVLDCQVDKLVSVKVDGRLLSPEEYQVSDEALMIPAELDAFLLETESLVDPANNTSLEGLYKSAGVYCTQCEAEGFRKITPFLDRPDVLSVYTVTIYADKDRYPYLLSNGNKLDSGELDEGETNCAWVKWQDPHPKPSYLFALVAGDFDLLTDSYTTTSGRDVELELFVDKGNLHLSHHAMASLKKSMRWDEQKYGLEYDLDKYMVVAVDFFNMGAMENKGLNVFNSKYVLADEATATDADYHGVEAVIAHEYFHNWTGNRVTCRDWFQLSLKEGLTVFRDQQFSADMGSEVLERIKHADIIRTHQFAEDAGPMAHPIRPQKVIEMNNFYTVTVYDKGAEVIRMLHSLLGESGFRAGMDLYFKRHDGQAVTCDDFVSAMADANGKDLSSFTHWYQQAGTPVVKVEEAQQAGRFVLSLSQSIPTRPEGESVLPLMIPVKYELLSKASGQSLERGTLLFEQKQQSFELACEEPAHLVLFENFSAPVKVERELGISDRIFMARHASDAFCRWDLVQSIWSQAIQHGEQHPDCMTSLVACLTDILRDEELDTAVKAELLSQPSFDAIAQDYAEVNVEQILENKQKLVQSFAEQNESRLKELVNNLANIANDYTPALVAKRRLKQVVLSYLGELAGTEGYLAGALETCQNMTETMAVVDAIRRSSTSLLESSINELEQRFKGNVLVLDKILSTVARVPSAQAYQLMTKWSQHASFTLTNPNRVRALYGAFVMANPAQFHHASGKGYEFLTDLLLQLDKINPQVAARMVSPLLSWKRYDQQRQALMQSCLARMAKQELSNDLFEKVNSAIA